MKKIILSIALSVIILSGASDWVRVVGSAESPLPPDNMVIITDSSGLFIKTLTFGYSESDTTIDYKNFSRVNIPGEYVFYDTLKSGKPQIPYIKLLIAVPDSVSFNITTHDGESYLLQDYLLYPMPKIVFDDSDGLCCSKEIYCYDTALYAKDTLLPGKFYDVISDGHLRNQRVLEVWLYPIQFNPAREHMYFYPSLDLRIEYSGVVVENTDGLGPFEEIGRAKLLNYPGIDRQPPPHDPPGVHYYTDLTNPSNVADYIIVTHNDFLLNETAAFWIHEFAQHRVDHNDFEVAVVKTSDIYDEWPPQPPDSLHKSLREFLVYAYENWQAPSMPDGRFAYCLFIGDWDYVPSNLTIKEVPEGTWVHANEFYFKELTDDGQEDIMLGRWPVKETNYANLVTIAQKTINYEYCPDRSSYDWRRRGLLTTGYDASGPIFDYHIDLSKPYFSDIGFDTLAHRWSDTHNDDDFADSLNKYLNQGALLASYFDHGGPETWLHYDTTNVKNLTNAYRLPVVLTMACFTANFQWDHPQNTHPSWPPSTCFAEHFLCNDNGGCVAYFGATYYVIGDNRHVEEAFRNALRNQYWVLGIMLYDLSLGFGTFEYCLLGDPALDLGDYSAYPDKPDLVIRPQGIDISLKHPFPYIPSNGEIPIQVKVWNIGGATAYDIDVKFQAYLEETELFSDVQRISEIEPRDTTVITAYWDTEITHPDYVGEIGDCKFMITVDPADAIDESWELNNSSDITDKVCLYPYQEGWPKKVSQFSQPEIANLDGIGPIEIVYACLDSVYVFNSTDEIFPGWPKYLKDVYAIVLGDIDCLGTIEIAAVSPEWISVYDYQGNILPGWPQQIPTQYHTKRFYGYPSMGYITGVDKRQIVMYIGENATPGSPKEARILVYNYNGGNPIYDFPLSNYTRPYLCNGASISDVNGDGKEEMIISYIKMDDPADPTERYTDIYNKDGLVSTFDWGNQMITPALADLNNPADGTPDILGCSEDMVKAYDAVANQMIWTQSTGGDINSSPSLGNVHPFHSGVEITFGNRAGEIHLRKKVNGHSISPWPYILNTYAELRTSPAIANINGDFTNDVLVSAGDYSVRAFNFNKEEISPYPLFLATLPSSPIIGDIDGDRKSEIILSSMDQYLHVWENYDSRVPQFLLEWPQYHHDFQRTGLHNWSGDLLGGDANPQEFSTSTIASFKLKKNKYTTVKIFNNEGSEVRTLVDGVLVAGTHHSVWDGKDNNFSLLPNGLYFMVIKTKHQNRIIPLKIER